MLCTKNAEKVHLWKIILNALLKANVPSCLSGLNSDHSPHREPEGQGFCLGSLASLLYRFGHFAFLYLSNHTDENNEVLDTHQNVSNAETLKRNT